MQDLQRWRGVTIGIVRMRVETDPGIGQVGRLGLAAYLEQSAVIGFANETEQVYHFKQGIRCCRYLSQASEAEGIHPGQPLSK